MENQGQTPYASLQRPNTDVQRRPSIFEQLSLMEKAPLMEHEQRRRPAAAVDDDDDGLDEPTKLPKSRQSLATPEIFIRSPSCETLRSRKSSENPAASNLNLRRGVDLF